MNRRAFLKRFGIGLSAAVALAAVPVEAIRSLTVDEAGRRLACEHMRRIYNEACRGRLGVHPTEMRVSSGLLTAYEAELICNERFITERKVQGRYYPVFKCAAVIPDPSLSGWGCVAVMPNAA